MLRGRYEFMNLLIFAMYTPSKKSSQTVRKLASSICKERQIKLRVAARAQVESVLCVRGGNRSVKLRL